MLIHCLNYKAKKQKLCSQRYPERLKKVELIKALKIYNIEEAWYWYEGFLYEGHGELIAKSNKGIYYLASLNHCSCYGPIDCIEFKHGVDHPEKFEMTKDRARTVTLLIEEIVRSLCKKDSIRRSIKCRI